MATVRLKSKADLGRSSAAKSPATARSRRSRKKRKSGGATAAPLRHPNKHGQNKHGQKHGQNKQGEKKQQPIDRATTVRISGALREFLESERGFLMEAQSLLMCIAKSMDESTHPETGPYYPDVVGLASDLLGRRAVGLDEMLLTGRLSAALR
jgi:hypothetical protein